MSATGERRTLAPQLDLRSMAELFFRRDPGEPFPYTFIHKVNVYSKPPEDLVRGRVPAPGPDGEERQRAWYFRSPVSAGRRNRQVGGGNTFWHPEGKWKTIPGLQGPDGETAYWRTLSYVRKDKNQPGAARKPFRNVRLGWCMVEIGLQKQDGSAALQWELCKVYRSPAPRSTADPAETSTAAAAGAGVVHPAAGNGVSRAEGRLDDSALQGGAIPEVTGGDMPCPPAPPPVLCDYNVHCPGVARSPALLSGPAAMHGTLAIAKKSNAASMAAAVVMKLAGSSIPSAERMKEMAKLVISFDNPVVVLSPMGDTAHKILLAAWKALSCDLREASKIDEFKNIRELHLRTIDELGLDSSIISDPLGELEHHLQCVAMTKEMNSTKQDNLVSSAERTSTIMFFEYLNELGKGTLQDWELHTIPTSGRDGWDLAAATIARELGLREMQVWKDQEIFTCDPNVCAEANPLPNLTFDEAAELGLFGAQSIQRAMECGISVRIKNSFNPQAPGTLITKSGNTSKSILTSIALKSNITILEIKRIRTLDDSAFVEKAVSKFKHFEYLGISVDWVATNEDMWFTLVPSKLSSQELIQPALDKAVKELKEIATVDRQDRSVISLIGNPQVSLDILGKVANVSLVVRDSAAEHCVRVLHSVFFELNGRPVQVPVPVNSPPAAAGSGGKRKADDIDDHPEAPPEDLFNPTSVVRQLQPTDTKSFVPNEDLDRPLLSSNENWFEEFELSAAAPAPHEGSPLFSNEQLNPFSVSPCIETMDGFLWQEEDLQPPRHVPKMAPKLRKPSCLIPRSLKIPQEVDRVIRVHRGVRSRLWLTITLFQNSGCLGFSTDWMATSEGKLPLTLVSSKLLRQEFIQPALDEAVKELRNIAGVHRLHDRSVISLTGNAQLSPPILRKMLNVLGSNPVVIEKVSRGSSKMTKVSLVVHGNVAAHYGEVFRSALFENERPIPVDSSTPSSTSGFSEDGISQISDRVRRLAIA